LLKKPFLNVLFLPKTPIRHPKNLDKYIYDLKKKNQPKPKNITAIGSASLSKKKEKKTYM
jgi:hypothetical protein